MKVLSRWAHRHTRLAIGLIIVCECVTAHNGFVLGAELLHGLSLVELALAVLFVVFAVVGGRHRYAGAAHGWSFAVRRGCIAGAFGANFLLALLLGGMLGHQVSTSASEWAVHGSRRVVAVIDTLPETRPVRRAANQTDYYAPAEKMNNGAQAGKRVGYILLFIFSIFLFSFSAGLACGFACAGNGFLAILTLLFGVGLLGSGAFFLARATERTILPMRELSLANRRRLRARSWLLLGITLLGLFLLTGLT